MRKSFTRLFSIFVLLLGLSFQMAYGITFDGPNSVPTDGNSNAKPADFATKFVVAFDVVPVISDPNGTVAIYKSGVLSKTLPISNVVIVGKTIEITHGITTFTAGESYKVAFTDGAVSSLSAVTLFGASGYDFIIGDYVAPKLLTTAASFTPAIGAVDVMGTLNASTLSLVIPFNEAVNVPAATNDLAVYIYKEDGTVVDIIKVGKVGATTITGGGSAAVTVPVAATAIFEENTKYYVSVDAGAFVDVSPNANSFGGLASTTTWTFTTRDNSAPAVSAKSVTAVTQTSATLNVTLTEKGKYYYGVYLAAATPSVSDIKAGTGSVVFGNKTVAAGGANVTASLTGLAGGVDYKAFIVTENSVTIGAPVVGTTSTSEPFKTVDNTAPTIVSRGTLIDAAKKTNALYMVFSEQVVGGSGVLDLRKNSDDSYVVYTGTEHGIPASAITSTKITTAADATKYGAAIDNWVSVIDLGMTLPSQVAYYVVFPSGYIKDVAGNPLTSIGGAYIIPINKNNWPVISSDFELPTVTVAFVTPASLNSDITITFNETVSKALGSTTDWAQVVALEMNNTPIAFTILPAAAANTSVITLDPSVTLMSNTVYTVKLRPNAVKDLNDNGITAETSYSITTGDLDPLAVQYGSSDGATTTTGLVGNSTIKIDFNKAVKVNTTGTTWVNADASNIKAFITFEKGATAKPFTVTYDAATFTVTVIPTDALASNAGDYVVTIDGTKVNDAQSVLLSAATGYVASQTYTVSDYEAPVVVLSNTGDVPSVANPTITITDANAFTNLTGGAIDATQITFKAGSASGANLAFSYGYTAGVITITPTVALETGKTYYYGIGASVKDMAGNVNAAKFASFTITTAALPPAIVANTYTLNGSSQTAVATKLVNIVPKTGNIVSLTVTFNDNIKETVAPALVTLNPGGFTASVTPTAVSGNTLTLDFSIGGDLASETVYTIDLPAGIVQGSTAYDATPLFAQFAGKTILFDSKDIVKPIASANTPTAAQAGVALNTAIMVDFSEPVILGTGNILIKDGASTVQTIAVNSSNVSLNAAGTTATITKTGDLLKYLTAYTLEIPVTAFTDNLSLNPLSAVYSGTFTTLPNPAPTVSTYLPAIGADMVALNTSIAMTFSEEIEKNYTPGVLTLKGIYLVEKHDGAGVLTGANYAFSAMGGTDVLVASKYIDDSDVAISGNTVSINFGVSLAADKDYYILVAPDAFRDKSLGSPVPGLSVGIITAGVWNFTTKDVNAPVVVFSYTKRTDNKVAITSDITITFSKPIEKSSGAAINDIDIATLFTLTKTSGPGTWGPKAFIGTISSDKKVVTILNSSLVTLGEMTALSNYTITITGAIRGVTNNFPFIGLSDSFTTSDYTAPVVTPSIAGPVADITKDEATILFTCTDNMNLASVYYTIQAGTSSTVAPSAAVVKLGSMKAIAGGSPQATTNKFTGLTEETSYVVWAVAVDEAGNESAVNKVVFITDDVTKPTLAVSPTSFDTNGKLTFTFSEAVSPAAASVRILDKASMKVLAVLGLNAVTGEPTQLITDAFAPAITDAIVEYYVEISNGLVGDVPVVAGDAINTYDGLFGTSLMVSSIDMTAPVFTTTVPALNATGVDLNFSIKLNFSEAVQKASTIASNAFLVEKWNTTSSAWDVYEIIDPAYVVTNGTSEVTVTLTRALSSTSKYQLTFDLASFKDMSGNAHAAGTVSGTITTKDVVAPTVTFLPAKDATAVAATTTLTMTFSDAIRNLDNSVIDSYDLDSLVWVKKAGVPVAFTAAINPAATVITLTIPVTANDQAYTYGFKAKFEDVSDNVIAADMAAFSTVVTPGASSPHVVWSPAKAVAPATSTWLGTNGTVSLTFDGDIFTNVPATAAANNLPVTAAYLKATALTVTGMAVADLDFAVNGRVISVTPKAGKNWPSAGAVVVTLNDKTIQIGEGNVLEITTQTSTYNAQDIVAPTVVTYMPAKVGLSGVSPVIAKTDKLQLLFNEDVKVGAGTVEIYRWDGVLAKAAMTVTVDAVNLKLVTLGDLTGLPTNQEYYAIVHAGIVSDVTDSNPYAGLTDVKVWKFMLQDDAVPQVSSYMPIVVNTPINTNLTINFDRPIALTGAGYVAIYESAAGGDAIQIYRGADNGTTSALSVSGSTATVNISDLAVNTQYFVEVAEGTFEGTTSLEKQMAIARADWTFTTEGNTAPSIIAGGYAPELDELQVDVDRDLKIVFDMPVEAGTGNIQLHSADGSTVYNFDILGTDVMFANDTVTITLPTLMITSQYYVIIPATAIRNTTFTPEYFGGITVPYFWKFNTTTDVVAPTAVADSYSPMGMVATPEGITFSIKFSEVVMAGAGAITIKNTDDNSVIAVEDVMFNADSTVTFNPATPLTFAKYEVIVPADAIKDGNNNFYDPATLAWTFEISDLTAPMVAVDGLSPADGTIDLPWSNDLSITFDEPVMLSDTTAKIKVYKQGLLGNSLVYETVITAANLSADMMTVTVTTDSLADKTSYMVLVDAKLVKDEAGNQFEGIADPTVWNFETGDYSGPVVASITTESLTNAKNTFEVAIMFDENVTGVAENVTVTNGDVVVTGSDDSYVATVTADDAAVVVLTIGTGVKDASDNALAAEVSKTITVGDYTAPTVVVTPPATPVATVFTIGLTFDEAVSGVASAITVTGGTLSDVTGTGTDYVVEVSGIEMAEVTVKIAGGVIKDMSPNTNKFAGQTLTYTIGDFTAPVLLTKTPSDNEVITDNHPILKMTFSENVMVGTGSLNIYKVATTTPALTIPITADMISGKVVTVSYETQNGLDQNTRYYVLVDGAAIEDNAGNASNGVNDAAAWTFKTGDFATDVPTVNVSLFKVYPNPFENVVKIESPSSLSKIVVTNIAGQVAKQIVNPSNSIQLNELRSGIYFISMYDMDNKVVNTAKIVKR